MYKKFALVFATLLLAGFFSWDLWQQHNAPELGQGDVQTLQSVITRWDRQFEAQGGAENLHIALVKSLAFSQQHQGDIYFNLLTGLLSAEVYQLNANHNYAVWLLANQTSTSLSSAVSAKNTQRLIGNLQTDASGNGKLLATLEQKNLEGLTLNSFALTEESEQPLANTLLTGSPSFLQRLYYSNKPWSIADLNPDKDISHPPAFAFFLPKVALAHSDSSAALAEKIAKGRKLFVDEKFNGNGRTCATCHRPENNHTIDPVYIAKLPANDPLFVAETNPDLASLENPKLLRQFGLILANVDGFDKPPVFRSVPHLFGLGVTIMPEVVDQLSAGHDSETGAHTHTDGTFYDVSGTNHMVGWSGDGAPGNGTLRAFALGAIKQHATKTLNRLEGVDFRLPTADELDAIEAYMLSLGRSADINLAKMHFNSALVEKGKVLFDSNQDEGTGKCKSCHNNAGANAEKTNMNGNRDSGIEYMDLHPARLVAPEIAYDGGFGKTERHECGPTKQETCYGNGRFNITSLIEAADTAPYFHNNSVTTLEEAIAFYNSDAFNKSPGAATKPDAVVNKEPLNIKIDSSKVVAIASFLRAINVLENIRNSSRLDERALSEKGSAAKATIRLAMADTEDAIQVLQQGYNLYPEALTLLENALLLEKKGSNSALNLALSKKQDARAIIATVDP